MQPGERSAFLAAEVRAHDLDRTLCALFAPPPGRDAILALTLLNWELARVPELVSQPMAGMIRYQWWRDGIEAAAAGRTREQPVLEALARPLASGRLDAAAVQALIDARESELEPPAFATLGDLEAHLAATAGRLQQLWLKILTDEDGPWREAALAAGVGYGLVGVARAVPWAARRGRVLLPETLLRQAGLTAGDVTRRPDPPRLAGPITALVTRARQKLDEARRATRPPRAVMPALLLARVAAAQARRLEAATYDPTQPAASLRPPFLPLLLAAAWLRRRP